jgi:hypothetical protein
MKTLIHLLLVLFLWGCGTSETADSTGIGNPAPLSKIKLTMSTAKDSSGYVSTDQGDTIYSVIILFKGLELMTKSTPVKKINYDSPFVFDILKNNLDHSLLKLDVEAGNYRKLNLYASFENVPFSLSDSDSTASSVRIDLSNSHGSTRILVDISETFRLRSTRGLKVKEGEEKPLNIVFKVDSWFHNVNWSKCLENEKFPSLISHNSLMSKSECSFEIEKISGAIQKSIRLISF